MSDEEDDDAVERVEPADAERESTRDDADCDWDGDGGEDAGRLCGEYECVPSGSRTAASRRESLLSRRGKSRK